MCNVGQMLASPERVLAWCDNMAVVAMWAAQLSKHQLIMHLMRCRHFVCAYFNLELKLVHIRGSDNIIADAVSRNLLQVIHKVAPEMNPRPMIIAQALLKLLVTSRPDWLSEHWNQLRKEYLRAV